MIKYRDLTNDELIEKLNESDVYDPDLCALICERAGLTERWARSDGEGFESVLYLAIERLTGA